MRSDFCGAILPEAGSGAIAPRERRELSLSWKRNPDGSLPAVRLTFVLFDDLKWEGSAATRDSLFKARERRAEDLAFWVAALSEGALQPPDKAREFLEAKKRERRATTAIAGNVFTVDADQVLDRIERTPAEFAGFAKMLASVLDRQRVQFTRHLSR